MRDSDAILSAGNAAAHALYDHTGGTVDTASMTRVMAAAVLRAAALRLDRYCRQDAETLWHWADQVDEPEPTPGART